MWVGKENKIYKLYLELLEEYGDSVNYWPQWCANEKSTTEREKIIIGMILVQRTSWHNANMALKNLKKTGLLSIKKIANLIALDRLTDLIRPAGFFQTKPKRLYDVCNYVDKQGWTEILDKRKTEEIRSELVNIKGVGPETADTILLYALDKAVFVIDEYTRRWVEKEKLIKRDKGYEELQMFFESNLDKDIELYRNLHALIIISQRGGEKARMEIV